MFDPYIPIFDIKYLTMQKVQMHAEAITKLLYGFVYVRAIIHSLKLVDYLPIQTQKPYNNLHLSYVITVIVLIMYCNKYDITICYITLSLELVACA